jgi:hypothetical protein
VQERETEQAVVQTPPFCVRSRSTRLAQSQKRVATNSQETMRKRTEPDFASMNIERVRLQDVSEDSGDCSAIIGEGSQIVKKKR